MTEFLGRLAEHRQKLKMMVESLKTGTSRNQNGPQNHDHGVLNGFQPSTGHGSPSNGVFAADDDSENEHEDELLHDHVEDPLQILSISGGYTADFRLNQYPSGVEPVSSCVGKPTFQLQRDSSSVLIIPSQSYLRVGFGNIFGREGRLTSYTIVVDICLDLKLSQCDGSNVSFISFQWPSFQSGDVETESQSDADGRMQGIIITQDGIIRTGLKEFSTEAKGAAITSNKWHRVVVTVSHEKKTLTTYIDGKKCGHIYHTIFDDLEGRFSVDSSGLLLFGSHEAQLRRLEVFRWCFSEKDVMENRRRLWHLPESVREILGESDRERLKKLSLGSVMSRPVPIWRTGIFHGIFTDRFMSISGCEGSDVYSCLNSLLFIAEKVISQNSDFMDMVTAEEKRVISKVLTGMGQSANLLRKVMAAVKQGTPKAVYLILRHLLMRIETLQVNDFLLVPIGTVIETQGGLKEDDVMLILQCKTADIYSVTIIATGKDSGVHFHSVRPSLVPAKESYQTALALGDFPKKRISDMSWWMWLFMLRCIPDKKNTAQTLYDVLGWLRYEPIDVTVQNMEESTSDANPADFRAVQSGLTGYYKVVKESLYYLCRSRGVSQPSLKSFLLGIRRQALAFVNTDIFYAKALGHADRMTIHLGMQQVCYNAIKFSKTLKDPQKKEVFLEKTLEVAEQTTKLVHSKQNDEDYLTNDAVLDLGDGLIKSRQADLFPFFDSFLEGTDLEGMEGGSRDWYSGVPVNLILESVHKAKSFEETIEIMRQTLRVLFTLRSKESNVRLHDWLAFLLLQRVFTYRIPVPLGPESRKRRNCIWSSKEIVYAQQQSGAALLSALSQHFVSSFGLLTKDEHLHSVVATILGAMVAMCDALLRNPGKDCVGGVTKALDAGFGISSDIFIQQSEIFPVYNAPLMSLRAEVLDYFSEIREPSPNKAIFSWEMKNYRFSLQDEGPNVEFARNVSQSLTLDADLKFVYSNVPLQTQLFPEFGCLRDLCLWWKWSMCPHPEGQRKMKIGIEPPCFHVESREILVTASGRRLFRGKPQTNLVFPSRCSPGTYTAPNEVHNENDVLHLVNLPDFEGALGQRDAELLLSYLTVPYLRIPLLMQFFASDDRIHALKNVTLRRLFLFSVTECGRYVPSTICHDEELRVPSDVPCTKPHLIGTTHGLLLNELQHSPHSILAPLQSLVDWAIDAAAMSVHDTAFDTVLFIAQLSARVISVSNYLIDAWNGRVPGFEVWSKILRPADRTKEVIEELVARLEKSLCGYSKLTAQRQAAGEGIPRAEKTNLVQRLRDRLGEVEKSSSLFCGMHELAVDKQQHVDEEDLQFYVKVCGNIHAHLILVYSGCSEFDNNSCTQSLSSVFFLTSRHDRKSLQCSETEVMDAIDSIRIKALAFLERMSNNSECNAEFQNVCQTVCTATGVPESFFRPLEIADSGKAKYPVWSRIAERTGRYVVSMNSSPVGLSEAVNIVGDAKYPVELDLQTVELRVSGGLLRSLDEDIAEDPDVRLMLGKFLGSLQCVNIRDTKECREREIVGTKTPIRILAWASTTKMEVLLQYDREYAPLELEDSEIWISDLFEPARTKLFCPPECKKEVQFFLPEKPYPQSIQVATLCGTHPSSNGAWFEVVLLKEFKVIQVFLICYHGGRFRRTAYYTNNVMLSYHYHEPNMDWNQPRDPWKQWNRHEVEHERFASLRADLSPPPYEQSCVIFRPIPQKNRGKSEEKMETFIPARFLQGLIPQALTDSYVFWQDVLDPSLIRGYIFKEGPQAEATDHEITMQLHQMPEVPATGGKGVCARIRRHRDGTAEDEILLNVLHSPQCSTLSSIARTLCWMECASYLLAWGAPLSSGIAIRRVEMSRLKASFIVRRQAQFGDESAPFLFSEDQPNMYVANAPFPSKDLLSALPHYLVLFSLENEWFVMTPNVNFVRPMIKQRPFSCEILSDPGDNAWATRRSVTSFIFSIHPSGCNLVADSLSSALYLMVLKMLHHDYAEVTQMVSSISTDVEMTQQEEQILQCLEQTSSDLHPDAHACRIKIELCMVDCPTNLPWDIREEAGKYFTKLRHVSAICRLSESEETVLIRASQTFHTMTTIVTNASARYNKRALQLWYKILTDKIYRIQCSAKDLKDAEDFVISMSTLISSKTGHVCNRKRFLRILVITLSQDGPPAEWNAVINRRSFWDSRKRNEGTAKCLFAARSRSTGWQYYCDKTVLTTDLASSDVGALSYEKRKTIGGLAAVELATELWDGTCDMQHGFLLLYEIMSGGVKVNLMNSPAHSFACLMFFMSHSDCRSGSYLGSILSIMCWNPWISSDARCPKLEDNRVNKQSSTWRMNPDRAEPNAPLRKLLTNIRSYMMESLQGNKLAFPPTYNRMLLPSFEYVQIANICDMLDICPSCHIQNYGRKQRRFATGLSEWFKEIQLQDSIRSFLNDYDAKNEFRRFCDRPLMESCREFVQERERESFAPELPFDVAGLLKEATKIERDMVERLQKDFETLSIIEAQSISFQLKALGHGEVEKIASGDIATIQSTLASLRDLQKQISKTRSSDMKSFQSIKVIVEDIANGGCRGLDINILQDLYFRLLRLSSHRPKISFQFLLQSLLSPDDRVWEKVNPNANPELYSKASDLLCMGLLHAVRASAANQVLTEINVLVRDLLLIMARAGELKEVESLKHERIIVLRQRSNLIGDLLGTKRSYVNPSTFEFVPHFLVFEFQSKMMLRTRQVEIVQEIMGCLECKDIAACVKQMIMGAGKTCVVSPLLALLLANSRNLVIQAMPPALLDFSRGVLRAALSNTFDKRVCTLLFERSDVIDSRILLKLKYAAESGAVVVTTPSSIKSLMLKSVENILNLTDSGNLQRRETSRQVKEAAEVYRLLRDATIIMDEVDTILHPLKSELNFPSGQKEPLQPRPIRWHYPLFILDTFLMAGTQNPDLSKIPGVLSDVICDLQKAIDLGAAERNLQQRPHWVLLSQEFYFDKILTLFTRLSLIWCEREGVDVDKPWIRSYIESKENRLHEYSQDFGECQISDRVCLNLVRHWLHLILPHILQKVDRVSFGLMNEMECKRALEKDPRTPRGRLALAIPFVGKDTPSDASEFAHPDVTIGLTILAYRYEGLRRSDFKDIIRALQSNLTRELGPKELRPSSVRYKSWIELAGGHVMSNHIDSSSIKSEGNTFLPLHQLRESNKTAFEAVYDLLRRESAVIHFLLSEFIFPRYMWHQQVKLSASAQELGSDMLFRKRVGFSGTPSSLIPTDLGECQFEPGSEARIMRTLSSPDVCSVICLSDTLPDAANWSPESILKYVAKVAKYKALIDTGALITGYSNLQAAEYLLKSGLRDRGIDGVVYLDERDRKMVLVAATGKSVKLEECGISINRRFAFYDQIHTTGMDIKHSPNASAVLTLGKDMVFRDLAQGAYRMRGIGKGQTLDFLIIPEVQGLIQKHAQRLAGAGEMLGRISLVNILVWLLINSMQAEKLQFNQLLLQNASNVYRKEAYRTLMNRSHSACSSMLETATLDSLKAFQEIVTFNIPDKIQTSTSVIEKIQEMESQHGALIQTPGGQTAFENIKDMLKRSNGQHGAYLDVEAAMEQEQEQEQEQEEEREQEIEIEKCVEMGYSRDDEQARSWTFRDILELSPEKMSPFYFLKDFKLWKRDVLNFPSTLGASENFYNLKWSGERRIKNVVMLLEVMPNELFLQQATAPMISLNHSIEKQVQSSIEALSSLVLCATEKSSSNDLEGRMFDVVKAVFDLNAEEEHTRIEEDRPWIVSEMHLKSILAEAIKLFPSSADCLRAVLMDSRLRQRNHVQYTLAVTLAEAETIRRIIHLKAGKPIIDGGSAQICLRHLHNFNSEMDCSDGHVNPPDYQLQCTRQLFKFFDGEVFFSQHQLLLILHELLQNHTFERQVFFENLMARKRRAQLEWKQTPLQGLFSYQSDFDLAYPQAMKAIFTHVLGSSASASEYNTHFESLYSSHLDSVVGNSNVPSEDETLFDQFDSSRDGLLSCVEVFAMLRSLGFRPSPREVISFVKAADQDNDMRLSASEFAAFLGQVPANCNHLRKTTESECTEADIKAEMKKLDDEQKERELSATSLRQTQESRLRAIECSSCSADDSDEAGTNPTISPKRARWDFSKGRRPALFKARFGCTDFLPDADSGNDKDEDQKVPQRHFIRSEAKAVLEFQVPEMLLGSSESEAHSVRCVYSVTVCVRIPELGSISPCGAPILSVGSVLLITCSQNGELSSNLEARQHSDLIEEEGTTRDPSDEVKNLESETKARMVENEWSVVTLTVDCINKTLQIFLDGALQHVIQDGATPLLPIFYVLGAPDCKIAGRKIPSVKSDLRFVVLDMENLTLGRVLEYHVPAGVWRCCLGCQRFNGPGHNHCQGCHAIKQKSASRPANDADENHPGLTIVVNQSFEEIVLNKEKHVFLDVSADWCGPSVQMKPEWHALAHLLKDNKDIIIAYMDADSNEQDRFYLSESHIPNLKLFPKGDKSNFVSFPQSLQRNVNDFIHFLEKHTGINIQEAMMSLLPEYLHNNNIPALISQAELIVASAIDRCKQRAFETESEQYFNVGRYLAMYFADTEVFSNHSSSIETVKMMKSGQYASSRLLRFDVPQNYLSLISNAAEHVQQAIQCVGSLIQDTLATGLPDKPIEFLAQTLARTPVVRPDPKTSTAPEPTRGTWAELFSKGVEAIKNDDMTNLENLLAVKGLPAKAHEGGSSLICIAAGYGNTHAIELLYDHGGNVNEAIEHGKGTLSALEIAASVGHEGATSLLIQKGAYFRESLHHAANSGHVGIVRLLLKYGAHPDVRIGGKSALTHAVLGQHDAVIEALAEAGAKVDSILPLELCRAMQLDPGSTILHYAAKNGFISSAKAIIKRWPEGRLYRNTAGRDPMDLAPIEVKCYIDKNFLNSLQILRKCIMGAAGVSNLDTYAKLSELFQTGTADANAQDVRGWTALMAAAIANDESSCKLLLDRKAKWSVQNRNSFTALFWAEASKSSEAAKVLREAGAQLSQKEQLGLRRLSTKFAEGDEEVKSLLDTSKSAGVMLCSPSSEQAQDFYDNIIQRMMADAEKIDTRAREVLPPNYKPDVTLERSILDLEGVIEVVEKWDKECPGEGDFPSWKSLVQNSKLFVQERVAAGDVLPPAYILALHLYTIPCNLFRRCNKAMRDSAADELKHFHVFIWYLWNALNRLVVKPMTVYRGINVNPEMALQYLSGTVLWPSFSSTSFAREVAASFMAKSAGGGVMFKIRAKSCREVMHYSYKPLEREMLVPPMSRFDISGVYEASNYNLRFGEQESGLGALGITDIVPMREVKKEELSKYAGRFVLVLLEEVDP